MGGRLSDGVVGMKYVDGIDEIFITDEVGVEGARSLLRFLRVLEVLSEKRQY
jgi:hypothetical protein